MQEKFDAHKIIEMGTLMTLGWENPRRPKPGKAYECFPQYIKDQCKQIKSDDIKDVSFSQLRELGIMT